MSNKKKEVIRRLLNGDHLTEIRKGWSSIYIYIIGYNGSSPLRVDEQLAQHLIHDSFLECSVGESSAYDYYAHEDSESHYMISTQTPSYETRLRKALKYSLGDTVEYRHSLLSTNKHKGIITKELDALCEEVLINGIGNLNFSVDNFVGITRMVLVEKTIKDTMFDIQKSHDIPDVPLEIDVHYDPYDYFDYLYNVQDYD